MKVFDHLRRWWQERTGEEETPFDGDTPAWMISIGVHLLALIVLTVLWQFRPQPENVITMTPMVEEEPEEIIDSFHFAKDQMEEIGANSVAGAEAALAMAPVVSDISDVPLDVQPSDNPTVEVSLNVDIPTGPNLSENMVVKGAAGAGATGAAGAIDRITHEILLSLNERQTMVVWLFDQSGSLDRTRNEIYERFDRIYKELGLIEESGAEEFDKHEQPLLTSVMAFGKQVEFLTEEPTADLQEIKAAVKGIKNDSSGIENVFTGVMTAVGKYQKYRNSRPRRNVMIVVVSDEIGDDETNLDKAIAMCQRTAMRVYCVGVPAPFGRREAKIKYVDPDPSYDQRPLWIPVDQGPESIRPERINIGFVGDKEGALDELDSGFGPFSLTRLCYDTGGIYFSIHANKSAGARAYGGRDVPVMASRLQYFFDPGIMLRYRPDYLSFEEYDAMLRSNKARGALVTAATATHMGPMEEPTLEFPKENEGALKGLLDEAQKVAAVLEPKVQVLYDVLKKGEKDREKLTVPRWQAGYDLAMGRVLAIKVRTETYNQALAALKGGRNFEQEGSDTWVLEPADKTIGSALERDAANAKMYLERVVKDHPGTPWALLAEAELKTPLGWDWNEKHTGVQERRQNAGNGNNNNNPNRPRPKPRRKASDIKL